MNNRPNHSLILPLALCLAAMAALLILTGSPSHALAGTRYVATTGVDIGACTDPGAPCETVQYAVDAAAAGDLIKVASGTYDDLTNQHVVSINKSVTIRGGYTAPEFADPADPEANPTTLDALGLGRVVLVSGANVNVTLEGLRLTGGNATGLDPDAGGGFCADEIGDVVIRDSEIYSNTADIGGGVYVRWSDSTRLTENEIYSNTARAGAGIYLHATGNPVLSGNEVYSNTSTYNGGGLHIASAYYETIVRDNSFHHNRTTGGGGGGGVYVSGTNEPWLFDNEIYSNTATSQGGGLYLKDSRRSQVIDNEIYGNTASSNGAGVYLGSSDQILVAENDIYGNRNTALTGGGMFLHNCDDMVLRDNQIHDNVAEAENGGGAYLTSCHDAELSGNEIYGNSAAAGGGLFSFYSHRVTLESNTIYSNTAGSGGGMRLWGGDDLTLVNNLLWGNETPGNGSGMVLDKAHVRLLHSTLARNGVEGILMISGATLAMSNTILVSHTTGIRVWTDCTATLSSTLWGDGPWANGTDWINNGTLLTGTANYWVDPGFHDAGAGDYHLDPESAAIDRGVQAGVFRDIDNEPRLGVPDLGIDEYWVPGAFKRIHLPLVARNASAP